VSRSLRRAAALPIVASVLGGLVAAAPVAAVTSTSIVVDTTADTNAVDGHCSFREAMLSAIGNSSVHGEAGECAAGSAATEDVITFGFPDAYTVLTAALPAVTAAAGPLRIAGDPDLSANNVIISGDDTYPIFVVDGGELALEKITPAHAAGTGGVALDVRDGLAMATNSNFAANTGTGPGAVILGSSTSDITLIDTSVVNNTVSGAGGTAVYSAGTLTVDGLILYDTHSGGAGTGGGVMADGPDAILTLTGSEIRDNAGAGLRLRNGATASLTDVHFLRNSSPAACGGAIDTSDSELDYTGGELFGNDAHDGAGLCAASPSGNGSVTLQRVSIVDNHAIAVGGGVASSAPLVTLANATISGNTAADAAGLQVGGSIGHHATVVLDNATIAENWNDVNAGNSGGVWQWDESTLTTSNTIIGSNHPANLASTGSATATHDHGVIDVDVSGTVVGPLAQNGGGILTHALLSTGGPALDKGADATCALAVVGGVDARGFGRPAGACDIGAVERDTVAPSIGAAILQFATGDAVAGSTLSGRVSWSGGDNAGGIGLRWISVYRSVNGAAFSLLVQASGSSTAVNLASGKTYRFKVIGEDYDGNTSAAVLTSTYPIKLTQQTTGVTYSGSWSTTSSASYAGGSTRYATKKGASASFKAKARLYTFVSTMGPKRGKARIYVNGVLKATVDLYSASTRYKVQVWSYRATTLATRTVKVVLLGTSGRPRVDVDAFAIGK
jgi:hypothetical protein